MKGVFTLNKQDRDNLLRENQTILDKAASEKRNLTSEEDAIFSKNMAKIDEYNQRSGGTYMTRREAMEAAERPTGRISVPQLYRSSVTDNGNWPAADPGDWRGKGGVATRAMSHGESVRSYLESKGGFDEEIAKIRPGAIMRALALGTSNEAERRALSTGVDTTGGYTVPSLLSASFIDAMRAASVMSRAGAKFIPLEGETSIARILADPAPTWRAENQAVADVGPTLGSVTFRPKTLAMVVKCSRELLEDSINIEYMLEQSASAAMALEVDRACMIGDNGSGEPCGIYNDADILEVPLNSTPSHNALLLARTALLSENSREPTAFLMHPRDEGAFSMLKDGEGLPYPRPDALKTVQYLPTTQLPITLGGGTDSIILGGDFKRALVGIRTDLRIEVLKERYADTLTYGFLFWMRADLVLEHPKAFVKVTGVQAVS